MNVHIKLSQVNFTEFLRNVVTCPFQKCQNFLKTWSLLGNNNPNFGYPKLILLHNQNHASDHHFTIKNEMPVLPRILTKTIFVQFGYKGAQ